MVKNLDHEHGIIQRPVSVSGQPTFLFDLNKTVTP